MVLMKHRPRHDEALLLDATVHAAPAAHLRQADRDDRRINFDDLDFDDLDFNAPAQMPENWIPARGADKLNHRAVANEIAKLRAGVDEQPPAPRHMPSDLVPLPLLASVPIMPVVRDRMSTVLWDIAAAYLDAGEPHAIRMLLAPIVEQLDGAR